MCIRLSSEWIIDSFVLISRKCVNSQAINRMSFAVEFSCNYSDLALELYRLKGK